MDMRKLVLGGLVASAVAVPATAASAAPVFPSPVSADATTHLTGLTDGGGANGAHPWAVDNLTRELRITGSGFSRHGFYTFTATITDTGSFKATANALTPNQGGASQNQHIKGSPAGTVSGTATYTFTANRRPSTKPNAGVPFAEPNGATASAENTLPGWYKQAFPAGTQFGPSSGRWSRKYEAKVIKLVSYLGPGPGQGPKPGHGPYPGPGCSRFPLLPGQHPQSGAGTRHGRRNGPGQPPANLQPGCQRGRQVVPLSFVRPGGNHHKRPPVSSSHSQSYDQIWTDNCTDLGQQPQDGNITG
jgi:hypothetical protein